MPQSALEFPELSQIYARFRALPLDSTAADGVFLFYRRLDSSGVAVAMAANVAGAASLGLEESAERAKAALRAGVCDFVVNSLDEALRILKNEIRQRRGVSVVLTAEAEAAMEEIIERGVQPEYLAFPERVLMERGARLLQTADEDALIPMGWSVERDGARFLPRVDALAIAALKKVDARKRWIEGAARYLGRTYARRRFVTLSRDEADAFEASIRIARESGELPGDFSLSREDMIDSK